MPKERRSKSKTQHEKFLELAHESGASTSERAFVSKLRKLARRKSDQKPKPKKLERDK